MHYFIVSDVPDAAMLSQNVREIREPLENL